MIDVLIITDGRDCVYDTIASARDRLHGDIHKWWLYHDGHVHPSEVDRLMETGIDELFWHPDGRQGFGGAIAHAWKTVVLNSPATHLFHLEDDFTFNRDVDLDDIAYVLDTHRYLAQMALRRQPWNDAEKAAGGVVELIPTAFSDQSTFRPKEGAAVGFDPQLLMWLEHREFWTTNPSLIRVEHILNNPWPNVPQSEGRYTLALKDYDPDLRFGYWGHRDSGEWVHHIGDQRVGTGY